MVKVLGCEAHISFTILSFPCTRWSNGRVTHITYYPVTRYWGLLPAAYYIHTVNTWITYNPLRKLVKNTITFEPMPAPLLKNKKKNKFYCSITISLTTFLRLAPPEEKKHLTLSEDEMLMLKNLFGFLRQKQTDRQTEYRVNPRTDSQ